MRHRDWYLPAAASPGLGPVAAQNVSGMMGPVAGGNISGMNVFGQKAATGPRPFDLNASVIDQPDSERVGSGGIDQLES